MPTHLIVTVDTEEEGLWSGGYRRSGFSVRNIGHVPRFQRLCEEFEIQPTYLVDTPVASDDEAVSILRTIQDSGRCEIGAHLHPWCGPPFEETLSGPNSYICNLPPNLQREKLQQLTDTIEHRFGRRPTSFRAGRYGLDIVGARCLEQLGYVVDSSVLCYYNYRQQGGPDFSQAPFRPYRISGNELTIPSPSGKLWEVPVSAGFSRRNFARAAKWADRLKHPVLRALRLPGICDRLGFVKRIKFSPEQADHAAMNRLADMYVANHAPSIVMLLHSSSLMPGGSPYVPDERSLERFYGQLQTTLSYCRNTLKMPTSTLTEFAQGLNGKESRTAVR